MPLWIGSNEILYQLNIFVCGFTSLNNRCIFHGLSITQVNLGVQLFLLNFAKIFMDA